MVSSDDFVVSKDGSRSFKPRLRFLILNDISQSVCKSFVPCTSFELITSATENAEEQTVPLFRKNMSMVNRPLVYGSTHKRYRSIPKFENFRLPCKQIVSRDSAESRAKYIFGAYFKSVYILEHPRKPRSA